MTPEIEGWVLIAIAKGSIANTKSRGDNWHTCWVPLERENGGDMSEFVCNMAVGLRYNSPIILNIFGPKFILCRTAKRKCHSMRLKTFSASSELARTVSLKDSNAVHYKEPPNVVY